MNPPNRPPSDDEMNRLLASRFKDTTPEFEARWRNLKRELRQAPPRPPALVWFRFAPWFGLALAGAAALWLVMLNYQRATSIVPAGEPAPALAELFKMDAALTHGTALLDPENRDALLHLPAHPQNRG